MTQKDFRNLFDSIRCSEAFTSRMEEQLSMTPESPAFSDTASGVSIAQKRGRWVRCAGIAACLLLVIGGTVIFFRQEKLPAEYPMTSECETTTGETPDPTETKTVTTALTERVTVTQQLVHTTADTIAETPETVTETTAPPQTEEIVVSDPTKPPETQAPAQTPSETQTEASTSTAPEKTTLPPIDIPVLQFDMAMFPMQELHTRSEDELLTAGYYYFYAAEALDQFLMVCPYQYDYMNTQGRAIEQDGKLWLPVTDATVQSTADVQQDFYSIFTSDRDSSHLSRYFMDTEDGLFCTDSTDSANPYLEGYYLTLETVTADEITYTCHIRILGSESTNTFSLVREEAGWKIKRFHAPDMIQTHVLPGPEYFGH